MDIPFLEKVKVRLSEWITIHGRGPYAIPFLALYSFLEAIIIPIPIETVLVPLVVVRARHWLYLATVTIFASVLGAVAAYAIGAFLYPTIGEPLVLLFELEEELEVVRGLFMENAFATVFVSAFTPIPFKLVALSAGLLNVSILTLIVAALVGRALRYLLVAYVSHVFGPALARLAFRYFNILTLIVVLLALVAIVVYSNVLG